MAVGFHIKTWIYINMENNTCYSCCQRDNWYLKLRLRNRALLDREPKFKQIPRDVKCNRLDVEIHLDVIIKISY